MSQDFFCPWGVFSFSYNPRVETRGHFVDQPDGLFYLLLATKARRAESYLGPRSQPGDLMSQDVFCPWGTFFSFSFDPRVKTRSHFNDQPDGLFTYYWQPKPIGLNHIMAPGFNLGIL
ncbi:hypothetical protein [Dyadobacter chenhuakuii]|uniref:Uncharacterized protein n=1 Tax=Dyadobacter chenhuakuii TaxID=2909339 RepID=A0ABY4XNL3_9BACT|nr:hypothetical protein [Dyadobacter chenhuakuii]MCF2494693.1 hypothetical protein [Dyadobacter chenhuakuii]USJ31985.1 hypothetical protein NFI80_04440 [Dyadobacter chenhuakuii]